MDYHVIKEGDLFFLTDRNGDITVNDRIGHGLYKQDTRFLSRMEIYVDGRKPVLLSSPFNNSYSVSMLLVAETKDEGAIEVKRERYIYDEVLYERITLTNYYPGCREFDFSVSFAADFQDMFIVRKYQTGIVGALMGCRQTDRRMAFSYLGADNVKRNTIITWDREGTGREDDGAVIFPLRLQTRQSLRISFCIKPQIGEERMFTPHPFEEGRSFLERSYEDWYAGNTRVTTDSKLFNNLYHRGLQDLRTLMTDVGYGAIPVAGLPWYAVPFGRDSLITALFMLPMNPLHVQGTLRTLAAYQGTVTNPRRDEEPGKIMHEIRFGELTRSNQAPFSPYYGGVDATALFLIVVSEYVQWTGDLMLVTELRNHIDRALEWIDRRCMSHNFGFVTYQQEAEKGFPNQGWKDSANSIVHETGQLAQAPIALVEVQGYAYQAKQGLAVIFEKMGDHVSAKTMRLQAESLKRNFEASFWAADDQFYAIALDTNYRQVRSITSNPGHLLQTGIVDLQRARLIAQRLMEDDMFNG